MGYALPTSRKYLAWYMQQQRKKRAASEPTAVQRYFTEFMSVVSSYIALPDIVIPAGVDFVMRGSFVINSNANYALVGGNNGVAESNKFFLYTTPTGEIVAAPHQADGNFLYTIPANNIELGKINSWELSRTGITYSMSLNGGTPATRDITGGTIDHVISNIGRYGTTNYISGIESDIYLEVGGTVVIDMPVNEDGTSIVSINRAGDTSVNSFLDPTDLTTAEWSRLNCTVTDSGLFDPDGNTAYLMDCTPGVTAYIRQSVSYANVTLYTRFRIKGTAGETIKVEVRASNSSVVSQVQHVLSGDWEYLDNATVVADWDLQDDSVVLAGVRRDTPNTADQVLISYGQLRPEYNGKRVNIAESQLFTEVADGWEGVELFNSPFVIDPQMTDNGDGTYTVNSPVDRQDIESADTSLVGSKYRIAFDVIDISAGDFLGRVGGVSGSPASSIGSYSEDITAGSGGGILFRATAGTSGTFRPSSVKQFLEVIP